MSKSRILVSLVVWRWPLKQEWCIRSGKVRKLPRTILRNNLILLDNTVRLTRVSENFRSIFSHVLTIPLDFIPHKLCVMDNVICLSSNEGGVYMFGVSEKLGTFLNKLLFAILSKPIRNERVYPQ